MRTINHSSIVKLLLFKETEQVLIATSRRSLFNKTKKALFFSFRIDERRRDIPSTCPINLF